MQNFVEGSRRGEVNFRLNSKWRSEVAKSQRNPTMDEAIRIAKMNKRLLMKYYILVVGWLTCKRRGMIHRGKREVYTDFQAVFVIKLSARGNT